MLNSLNLKQVLFLDIETVPQYSSYDLTPEGTKKFWEKKSAFFRKDGASAGEVYQRAGIYAEFGKIICISVGVIIGDNASFGFKLKSFIGENEKTLLEDFLQMLLKLEAKNPVILCAHNGKEFDYPYIARRLLVNGLTLPETLNSAGKKPWEIIHLDTLELWKFGDYKHYTSLDLLTSIFDIPSPKEEIDGSMVAHVFYHEKDLEKIVRYCENDVIAVVQVLLKYKNLKTIDTANIIRTVKG
jgi:DNA polymerase elongation subunit (family B)